MSDEATGRAFPYKRAAQILCEAYASGDKRAAAKFGITVRTICNYRVRMRTDPELKQLYQFEMSETTRGWHDARRKFLRAACERATELLPQITADNIKDLANLMDKAGQLDIAVGALNSTPAREFDADVAAAATSETDDVSDQSDYEDGETPPEARRVRAASTEED